jgi:hypothetical protein
VRERVEVLEESGRTPGLHLPGLHHVGHCRVAVETDRCVDPAGHLTFGQAELLPHLQRHPAVVVTAG